MNQKYLSKRLYFRQIRCCLTASLLLLFLLTGCGNAAGEPPASETGSGAGISGSNARDDMSKSSVLDRSEKTYGETHGKGERGEIRVSKDGKTIYVQNWVDIDQLSNKRTKKAEKIVFGKDAGVWVDWNADYIYQSWLKDAPLVSEIAVEEGNPCLYVVDGMLIQRAGAKCDGDSETLWETLILCAPCREGEIRIPEGVQYIYDCAFLECSGITSVFLPASLKSVGGAAFGSMDSCTSIQIDKKSKTFYSQNGILYGRDDNQYGATCIIAYPAGKRDTKYDTVPKYIREVGCGAFFGADQLREVRLPTRIDMIYDSAFQDCRHLQKVVVKNRKQIAGVAKDAYDDCPRLKEYVKGENWSRRP